MTISASTDAAIRGACCNRVGRKPEGFYYKTPEENQIYEDM